MTIQYCSDLHLEESTNSSYLSESPLHVKGDLLILAGDIAPLHDIFLNNSFFSFISDHFRHTFWVPGNHEFYQKDIGTYPASYHIKLNNKISLVHNVEIEIENTRLIFSSLWSEISEENTVEAEERIPDFSNITKNKKRFTVADFNFLHKESLDFLHTSLQKKSQNSVIVTHHAPCRSLIPQKHKFSKLNEAFYSNLDTLVAESDAGFWIYGHTHSNHFPQQFGKTFLLTNQFGYSKYNECADFRKDAYLCI
jgi:predicted phosphodiesterase